MAERCTLLRKVPVFLSILAAATVFLSLPALAGGRGLTIGVNLYPYLEGDQNLNSPALDARRMADFAVSALGMAPDDILVLTDEDATGDQIRAAFRDWLAAGTRPGDPVFIFFAGHGHQLPDNDGDEPDGRDEVLVPYDGGDRSQPDMGLLRDDEIGELLGLLSGRRVTMIVESCHSGTVTRAADLGGGGSENAPRAFYAQLRSTRGLSRVEEEAHNEEDPVIDDREDHVTLWTAASSHQLAWGVGERGIFSTFFLEGVRTGEADSNGNGVITNVELLDYVRAGTHAWCRGVELCLDNGGFTPTLEGPPGTATAPLVAAGAGQPPQTEPDLEEAVGTQNPANARVEILPRPQVRLGERVTFRIAAETAGYLVLVDENPAGEIIQLFPNRYAQEMHFRVEPGRPVYVPEDYYPFAFVAREPAGEGQVIAIVVQDRTKIDDVTAAHMDLQPIRDPNAYFDALARALREPTRDSPLSRNRAAHWSVGYAPYFIAR